MWDNTWNCQSGRLQNEDPDLTRRYDPWEEEDETLEDPEDDRNYEINWDAFLPPF